MQEILFLLLPIAFYSGWHAARKRYKEREEQRKDVPQRFVQGINYLLSEEPDKALDVFLNYAEVDEHTANTFLLLGNLFRNRGEINRALRIHQNLVARSDLSKAQRISAMLALGEDFFAAGLLDRAESVFSELLKDDPKHADACEPLRNIYEQLHEWDKAIEIAQLAQQRSKLDHSRLIAHYYCEIAAQELQKQNLFRAEETIKKAAKVYPVSARVLVLKGDLAYARNQREEALGIYHQAIEKDTRLIGVLFNQLVNNFNQKDELESLRSFIQQTFAKTQDTKLFGYLLQLARKLGKLPEMRTQVEEYLTKGKPSLNTVVHSTEVLSSLWQEEKVCDIAQLQIALQRLSASQPDFQCAQCGYKMHGYLWRCPACHQWDTVSNV
ncbi:Lipopolysaccharide biosynthesis regulator YciM, contains six TPR domains and a predicted metal-binding C-terminal domain [Thiothrix caldifontis]|uniref:Lipopolysaccharide biosynthesis regulator YciM, contains six TPR domains and a predicted metal-binding C-terminal domain n=1 Tax=Thiothrix caldifontis TaxID=525918 RepID=A0A1H4A7V6_9GAMM|nr:tetratricopeptide repeat protein [Thiothrix caldifontis]SEA31751.1 Lipopolysaccharide biosynthesis regulator YciM, contains six TPR domains and a predicted metal-binding C-terminal domain [Thiothrix caldifontis]